MEDAIKNLHFSYKPVDESFDDPKSSETNVRIFRDLTTDIYTSIFLSENTQLANFLDYTFHLIYSTIIKDLNILLMENGQKPLMGYERVYLVFKGGTLMNQFYSSYIKSILQPKYANASSKDVRRELGVDISKFNYDKERDEELNGEDNFDFFCNEIMSKKFAISDTDYSLYIYAENEQRYLTIYKFAIQLLARAFDIMTKNFDTYIYAIDYSTLSLPIRNDTPDTTDDVYLSNEVLDKLKLSVDMGDDIQVDYYVEQLNMFDVENETRIYKLYDMIEMATLVMYKGIDFSFVVDKIKKRITQLVEKKFVNIVNGNFYTIEKIDKLRETLKNKFTSIQNDKENNTLYYNEKIEETYDQYNTYILKNNNDYSIDSFSIKPRTGNILIATNNILDPFNNIEVKDNKIHYTTFNATINKKRSRFKNVINFDLMRTKFNVEMQKGFVSKNKEDIEHKIPSEFVDVSIPRYDDKSRIHYFDSIQKMGFKPFMQKIKSNGKNIIIYSYSIQEVADDLQYILFSQNRIQPWIDKKYKKRLVRFIFFLVLSYYIEHNMIQKHFYDLIAVLRIFDKIKKYLSNGKFPFRQFGETIKGENIDRLLKNYFNNICGWEDLPEIEFKESLKNIKEFLRFILIFSFLYPKSDECLLNITDKYDYEYFQINQYDMKNISEIRNEFSRFLDICVDYGIKICYPFYKELVEYGLY